ncbi:DsbA family protein [Oryzibacter oryziterrae]|uniref:DsbA family protein n=1 Tax=Oryzibacter oryziterrae TaxID=2766474 RepID=UPI001F378F45|nr:DsbA family protein [Oryzibacter oryziterrae]
MRLRFAQRLAALFIAGAALTVPAMAGGFNDAQKSEIGDVVKAYIMAHPEVIQDALDALEQKKQQDAAAAQSKTIASLKDTIYASKRQAVLGDPKAPITLVEFFDYNCGYCKRALSDTRAMLDHDKDVKIVLKEFPILGPGSVEAAKVAAAVNIVDPAKYEAFHFELLGAKGQADEKRALDAAAKVGVDVAALKQKIDDPEIANTIQEAYALAQKLDISGTPTYVIGEEVVFGAVGIDELTQKVASMRSCGKATC